MGEHGYIAEVAATIEGHPESVLRELLSSKANTKRSAQIKLRLKKPTSTRWEDHWLPVIVNGDTNAALEHLGMLFRQGFLSVEAESQIAMMIDNFGRATR